MSSIPMFTAEASLGRGDRCFVGDTWAAVRDAGEVVAQAQRVRYPIDCPFIECDLSNMGNLRCWCSA